MKAYVYTGRVALDALLPTERPDPTPGPNDVVLRMRAASLNYRDLAIERGHYHVNVAPPLVPLSDGAGEVVSVGERVTRVRVGDLACPVYLPDWIDGPVSSRVVRRRLGGPNDGVLAELMCLNEEAVVRAPAHLGAEEAATLPVTAVTAWHSIHELGALRPDETMAVLGSGGLSTAAIQIGVASGARVVAVTRKDGLRARLLELGADEVIAGASDDWPARMARLTPHGGADVVVDVAGGPSLPRSIAALRKGGTVHLVGYAAGTGTGFDIYDAIRHGATIRVATAGSRANLESVVRAYERHRIRPAVDRVFPVERIHDAFQHLAQGAPFGKVVVSL